MFLATWVSKLVGGGISENRKEIMIAGVAMGGPFLDEEYSGWRDRVNRSTVKMANSNLCVLAQASGKSYFEALRDHDLNFARTRELGFIIPSERGGREARTEYAFLKKEWSRQHLN